jgi:hypothetical protein
MAKKTKKIKKTQELDSAYLLKLVLYVIVGAQWIRFTQPSGSQIPIPIGLFIGIIFASHDHFQIDRKIEYAVIIVAALIGFWAEVGIYINT